MSVLKNILKESASARSVIAYANLASFPSQGVVNTIYIDEATHALYYWDGSSYVETNGADPIIDGEVDYYADLPPAALNSGKTYYVKYWSISNPTKLSGLYLSNGTTWSRRDDRILYSLTDLTAGSMLRSNGGREIIEKFTNPATFDLVNGASGQTDLNLYSSGWQVLQGSSAQNFSFGDARNYPATGWGFVAHNNSSDTMYLANNAGVSQKDLAPGCTSIAILTDKSTANGVWAVKDIVPQDIRTTASPTFAGLNLGAGSLTAHAIKPDATDGLLIESNNGTDIGLLGAANTANVTWYGTHKFNILTASKGVFTDASKNLTTTGTLGVDQGGTGTNVAFTQGSVLFAGASGVYSQSNASLFWDDTNKYLGIGTASPSATLSITRASAATSGAASYLRVVAAADTGLTASTESPLVYIQSNAASRSWATGNLSIQRTVLINRATYLTTSTSTWTDVATLGITGCSSSNNASLTITNSHALLIGSNPVSNTTNSFGLTVNASTGATNNYAAQFIGGNTGFGVSAPTGIIHAQNSVSSAACPLFERSGNASDSVFAAARVMSTKTTDMGNGFGTSLQFAIRDNAAVNNDIAEIQAVRANSSDTTGNILLRTYSGGTAFTNLQATYDKTLTVNVASSGYAYFAAGALPYNGSGGDSYLKLSSTSSNAAGGLQLGFNYIGTEKNGFILAARYGGSGSYRSNGDLMLSQYMGESLLVWESRMLVDYLRAFKFSTTGSGTNDITFDSSGNLVLSTGLIQTKTTAGITASTTQTQGQGALTSQVNQVSTVANANDTVTLPAAVAGIFCVVVNNGANTLKIYPASGDNLGAGVNTSTTLAAGAKNLFVSYDATNWVQLI